MPHDTFSGIYLPNEVNFLADYIVEHYQKHNLDLFLGCLNQSSMKPENKRRPVDTETYNLKQTNKVTNKRKNEKTISNKQRNRQIIETSLIIINFSVRLLENILTHFTYIDTLQTDGTITSEWFLEKTYVCFKNFKMLTLGKSLKGK